MPRGITRYAEAAHQGRLWTPYQDRANMALWFDITNRSSITADSSGNIQDWRDLANGIVATQATSTERPAYDPKRWLGSPSPNFTDDSLIGVVSITTSTLTVGLACLMESGTDSDGRFIGFAASLTGEDWDNQNRMSISRAGASTTQWEADRGTALVFNHAGLARRTLLVVVNDNTNMTVYLDGVSVASQAETGAFAITHFRLGASLNTAIAQLTGEMPEIIVDKGTPSTRQRQRIEGYLAHHNWNRWGHQNTLNGNHPYKSRPPLIGA